MNLRNQSDHSYGIVYLFFIGVLSLSSLFLTSIFSQGTISSVLSRGGSGLVFLPYLLFLPVPAYRYWCTIYYPAVNFRSVRRRHDREEPDPDNRSAVHRENSTHQDFSDKPRTHVGEHAPRARRPIINCAAELIRRKRPPSRRGAMFILFVCNALYHYILLQ